MVVRIWHGRTKSTDGDAYAEFLRERAIPDYGSVQGLISVEILSRVENDVTHFLTVTHWETEDAIRAFAGDDLLKAKYYPEDDAFLLEKEPEVTHHTVEGRHEPRA